VKALLDLERWVGKVESFLLAFSLIAMLSLTLYSVAYRNLVAPFVLKMQASEMNQEAKVPVGAPAATTPAPAAPAAVAVKAPADGTVAPAAAAAPSAGDLDDEPAAPAAKAAASPAAANAPSAGDLDDEPAAPAAKAAAAPAANAPSAGDLDDEPATPAKAVAAAPSAGAAAAAPSAGDLDDEPAAPAPGAATAPTAPAAGAAVAAVAAPANPAPAVEPPALEVRQDSTFLRVLKALNFAWIDKVTLHLLLWVGFFGAAIAAGKRKHIKIDALSRLIPAAFRERLQILLDLVAATACFFLANAALKFMASETASGTVFYGPVPGWAGILIIPVGFGLLLWHFLLDAVFEIALWAGNKTPALLAWKEELQRAQEEVA